MKRISVQLTDMQHKKLKIIAIYNRLPQCKILDWLITSYSSKHIEGMPNTHDNTTKKKQLTYWLTDKAYHDLKLKNMMTFCNISKLIGVIIDNVFELNFKTS